MPQTMKDLLGPRFGAFAIDYFAVVAAFGAYVRAVGHVTSDGSYQVTGLPALAVPAFWVLWLAIPEWLWGATLGKKIIGLRVRKADGSSFGFGDALLRRVCDLFDFWTSFGLVATICHLKTAKRQRVGDMAAGTVVVRLETNG